MVVRWEAVMTADIKKAAMAGGTELVTTAGLEAVLVAVRAVARSRAQAWMACRLGGVGRRTPGGIVTIIGR